MLAPVYLAPTSRTAAHVIRPQMRAQLAIVALTWRQRRRVYFVPIFYNAQHVIKVQMPA
jgi:hypothetical protein